MLNVKIADIMTENIITLKEDATVSQAAHIMLRYRINGILLVRGNDETKVTGIVTTDDLLKLMETALSSHGKRLKVLENISNMPCGEITSGMSIRVSKNDKLKKIIAIMTKYNKHTLPVFDNGKVVGVVGRHDILNAAFG